MTTHDTFIRDLKTRAKAAGAELGPQAKRATCRPSNYSELSAKEQWEIDKFLGVLDWNGEWNK